MPVEMRLLCRIFSQHGLDQLHKRCRPEYTHAAERKPSATPRVAQASLGSCQFTTWALVQSPTQPRIDVAGRNRESGTKHGARCCVRTVRSFVLDRQQCIHTRSSLRETTASRRARKTHGGGRVHASFSICCFCFSECSDRTPHPLEPSLTQHTRTHTHTHTHVFHPKRILGQDS